MVHKINIEEYLEKLGDHFVGLWSFKRYEEPSNWCVTISYKGDIWDLDDKITIQEAFEEAIKLLEKLENDK